MADKTDKTRRGRGAGSYFRTSQGWVAQVRVYDPFTGKSRQIRRRAKSRDHARDVVLPALLSNPGSTTSPAPEAGTVAAYLTDWIAGPLQRTSLSPNGRDIQVQCLTFYAIPEAGALKLSDLDASTAGQWLDRISARRKRSRKDPTTGAVIPGDPLSASTVRNVYNAIVKALDYATKTGVIRENYMRLVDRPKSPRPRVPVTKADEVDRLLDEVKGYRIEPLVWFVAFTGCRVGEAMSLRWEDLDLDAGTATIRQGSHTRETTKSGRARTLSLLPEVVEQLQAQRTRQAREKLAMGAGWQNHNGLVFTAGNGAPLRPDNSRRDLARALRNIGANPARPWHSLRHGLAHRLLQRGMPLHMVSAILGHSGIQITADTYGHVEATVPVDVLAAALDR